MTTAMTHESGTDRTSDGSVFERTASQGVAPPGVDRPAGAALPEVDPNAALPDWAQALFRATAQRYGAPKQRRADDLALRNALASRLADARSDLESTVRAWKRTALPMPTRAQPHPDPEALALAADIDGALKAWDRLDTVLRSAPTAPDGSANAAQWSNDTKVALQKLDEDLIVWIVRAAFVWSNATAEAVGRLGASGAERQMRDGLDLIERRSALLTGGR